MGENQKERILAQLMRIEKEKRWMKIPLHISMAVVSAYYGAAELIAGNTKKLVSLACLFLFFTVGSSFASIGITTGNADSTVDSVGQEQISGSMQENAEVVDGYEKHELDGAKAEVYSADDILKVKEQEGPLKEDGVRGDTPGGTVFDRNAWNLVLINKQHPIPEDYTFQLGTIKTSKGNMKCDERIIDDLMQMLKDAREEGIKLVICSPYRDLQRQEYLFNKKIKLYMKKDMSYMEAYKEASQAVTVPGASEHQIGLALDIVCDSYMSLNEGFGDTEAGRWLRENCSEYGFILRYPKGKEYITSIGYEPWHFRYVGHDAAEVIMDAGITLEEFVEGL